MHNDNQFLTELANVPPVPANAFNEIIHTIKRKNNKRKLSLSIAASIFFMIGISSYFVTTSTVKTSLKPEVADELQIARDFVNGDDIDNDYNQYVFLESNDL